MVSSQNNLFSPFLRPTSPVLAPFSGSAWCQQGCHSSRLYIHSGYSPLQVSSLLLKLKTWDKVRLGKRAWLESHVVLFCLLSPWMLKGRFDLWPHGKEVQKAMIDMNPLSSRYKVFVTYYYKFYETKGQDALRQGLANYSLWTQAKPSVCFCK